MYAYWMLYSIGSARGFRIDQEATSRLSGMVNAAENQVTLTQAVIVIHQNDALPIGWRPSTLPLQHSHRQLGKVPRCAARRLASGKGTSRACQKATLLCTSQCRWRQWTGHGLGEWSGRRPYAVQGKFTGGARASRWGCRPATMATADAKAAPRLSQHVRLHQSAQHFSPSIGCSLTCLCMNCGTW